MTDEQIVYVEALVALAVCLVVTFRRPTRETLRDPVFLATVGVFAVGAAVRLTLVRPSLIHADMLGPCFVDSYLAFPEASQFRPTYGGFGYFAVGAVTRLFGHDTSAVFQAMQVFGLVTVALLGALAHRLAGSMHAALFAVALSVTSPALMRVAASEDMHGFAMALGVLALLCMDHHASTRRPASLVAAVIALGLLAHTRQSFYLFAPLAFLLALARGGWSMFRSWSFWLAGVVVLTVLLPRVIATSSQEGQALPKIVAVLTQPWLVAPILRHHVCFDVVSFGALPLLIVASLGWSMFSGNLPRAVLVGFTVNFLATYPCGFPSPGVQYAQRTPVLVFALLLAALFATRLVEIMVTPAKRVRATIGAGTVFVLLPLALPSLTAARTRTTDFRESELALAELEALPRSFALVTLPSPMILQGASRYAGELRRHGKRVRVVSSEHLEGVREPLVFLEGVECWTYTFRELTGEQDDLHGAQRMGIRFDRAIYGRERLTFRPPRRIREECRVLLEGATPLGSRRALHDPEDDPPFLFYATSPMPVQFHRLRPAAGAR